MLGIYDSGLGGITVLNEILKLDPDLKITYLGDAAHCPLGEKTPNEITQIVTQGIEFLFAQGCDLVVLACNTATAVSIRQIQNQWLPAYFPHKKVLGIIRPTTELLTENKVGYKDKIAIFATPATIQTGFYQQEFWDYSYRNVLEIAFSGLAGAIENQDTDQCKMIIQTQLQNHLAELTDLKYIVLACTHYPIISRIFHEVLDDLLPNIQIQILNQAQTTTQKLFDYTLKNPEFKLEKGELNIFCSKDPVDFQSKIQNIFGLNENVKLYRI
jgi:glutamate racemase